MNIQALNLARLIKVSSEILESGSFSQLHISNWIQCHTDECTAG